MGSRSHLLSSASTPKPKAKRFFTREAPARRTFLNVKVSSCFISNSSGLTRGIRLPQRYPSLARRSDCLALSPLLVSEWCVVPRCTYDSRARKKSRVFPALRWTGGGRCCRIPVTNTAQTKDIKYLARSPPQRRGPSFFPGDRAAARS